ncbi:Uma2 family endonuclease [Fibrella forsythiae]|uniref:Uma2 family endonuclease n=1 Tax=Fibrella forsythiae TaxID=2817061 RepID=A0ABS3JKE4_9BACT|nr:Uma2 family endonuclease [Fibrella forsythiae]MBO0950482.1 Uma2 family endonuclease [Fibrella forsythiae]
MQATTLKIPDSLEDDELLRLPATWGEYLDVIDNVPYTVQFLNDEIIMSQASADHEKLIIRIGALLMTYFDQLETSYSVLSSNVKIVISNHQGDFNADISVVKEPIQYGNTPGGKPSTMRIENPLIVVEVLSKSTRKFDQGEKMNYYKLIPSLQHIVFIDQLQSFVSVYSRTNVPDEWLNHDYRTLESTVRLGTLALPMSDIYRKTVFA